MKTISSFALLTLGFAVALPNQSHADVADEIPLGIEVVTGYRSGYIYRGFELGEDTIDIQLETEITLNDYTFLNIGAWYATETGNGDFDESAVFTRLQFEKNDNLTIGLSGTYRAFSHSTPPLSAPFADGVDVGIFATWKFCKDFDATLGAYYDTGADGWYGHLETRWSKVLTENSFFALKTGVSYVDSYYGRNGINDAYGRISYTYHISENVSITPFVGGTVLLDDNDPGSDKAYGGLWFEVRF